MYDTITTEFGFNEYKDEVSTFYSLEPRGRNSYLIECLTSYITRLASVHNVSTGRLLIFINQLNVISPLTSSRKNPVELGKQLNGVGSASKDYCMILNNLTLQQDLTELTLIPWVGVRASRLLRKSRAWCPLCLSEWKNQHKTIYEPLIWSMKHVTFCPKHNIRLHEQCIHCKSDVSFLVSNNRVGRCTKCYRWLGEGGLLKTEPISEWERWIVNNIVYLMDKITQNKLSINRDTVEQIINSITNDGFKGNISEAARKMGFGTILYSQWKNGYASTPLEAILKMAYYVDTPVTELMANNYKFNKDNFNVSATDISITKKKRDEASFLAARNKLRVIIDENEFPPPSVCEVGRRLKLHTSFLYRHAGNECKIISDRYMSYKSEMSSRRLSQLHSDLKMIIETKWKKDGQIPGDRYIQKKLQGPYYHEEVKHIVEKVKQELNLI
ncbi:TniQ family protein [Paenibacillus sp. GP183]|uniref:TniQ family protein n=1 Tax=Paenibacillus sp. GP183 TaxID=1882751 RepID=UPI0008953A80|nr:TniQ family protein [Paenibacillus sp. GP183]SEC41058.1 TniQ protein [Paenibacillus sp. GP183]